MTGRMLLRRREPVVGAHPGKPGVRKRGERRLDLLLLVTSFKAAAVDQDANRERAGAIRPGEIQLDLLTGGGVVGQIGLVFRTNQWAEERANEDETVEFHRGVIGSGLFSELDQPKGVRGHRKPYVACIQGDGCPAPEIHQPVGSGGHFQIRQRPRGFTGLINPVEEPEHNPVVQFQLPDPGNVSTRKEVERNSVLTVAPHIEHRLVAVEVEALFRERFDAVAAKEESKGRTVVMTTNRIIGIDLGTTLSVVAVMEGSAPKVLIKPIPPQAAD